LSSGAVWILVNPKAGSGRALSAATRLAARFPEAELHRTEGPGGAIELARRAREAGARVVVAVGGDGTIQECVTGLCLDRSGQTVPHATALAVLPAGTGGDFRKTFGWTDALDQAEARVREPEALAIDVGLVRFARGGRTEVSAFANVLSFGLGGLTDRLVEQAPKWIGGRAAFYVGAVRATFAYQPLPLALRLDDQDLEVAPYSNVAVCNAQFFGGGMKIAPDADPSDGLFDVVTMELSKVQTLSLTGSIYRGTHLRRSGISHYRCRKLEARPTRPGSCLIDVDGEQLGELPISIEILPRALNLLR
jgi:YegS/Rv2252/BmrU family lipid kinase